MSDFTADRALARRAGGARRFGALAPRGIDDPTASPFVDVPASIGLVLVRLAAEVSNAD